MNIAMERGRINPANRKWKNLDEIHFVDNIMLLMNLFMKVAKYLDDIFGYNKMAVDGFYYDLFRNLEDKTHTDKQSLEDALIVLLNNAKTNFFGEKNKVVGIKMITTKEEMEKRMQQQEQQENQQLSK